jgi:exosortase
VSAPPQTRALLSVVACAAAGGLVFQFWGNATHGYIATNSLFYWWGFQWVNPASETEHAWLILALSIFLLGRNLRDDRTESRPNSGPAVAALLGGLALHAIGFICQQPRVSILALLVFLWGLAGLGGGRRWSRAALFPLGFMVFAIPVNALDTVGFWLQMWVVQAGEKIAHGLGIGVIRNGTQLFSAEGRYQYDVVAACSGVRSLMALTALALFVGYLWFRPVWLRAVILLASLPLVYLGNVVRIVSIIVAANAGGQETGNKVHDVMGYAVFAIVLAGVIGLAEGFARRWPALAAGGRPPAAPAGPAPAAWSAVAIACAVAAASVGEAAFLSYRASSPLAESPGVYLAADGTNPIELPTYLGSDWMGRRVEPAAIERTILPPDTGFSRKLYLNLQVPGQRVLLSVVLSGRDRTSIHRPELCLVGQGWTIDSSSRHRFGYPGGPDRGFDATVLAVHRNVTTSQGACSVPELVVYWFVGDDRVVATQGGRMLYDAWTRLFRGRSPRWAYVFLQTGAGDGAEAGLGRIQSILSLALPSFQPAGRRAPGA